MRFVLTCIMLCLFVCITHSQELSIAVAANKYKVQKDTITVERKTKEVSFTITYTITGTNRPVSVNMEEGPGSTLKASDIVTGGGLRKSARNFSQPDYSDKIDIKIPAGATYEKDEYTEIVFTWADMLNTNTSKTKKLVIKTHTRKDFEWVEDKTNTPKLEFIQYTDFLGINSDKPNGVFQQQLLFKWPIFKSYWKLDDKFKVQFLRSVLLPNILMNRIDKAKDDSSILVPLGKSVVMNPNSSVADTLNNVVGSFDLIRYANTVIESSINLLTLHIDSTRVYVSYDFGLLRDRIYDTISQARPVSRPIYSYITGWHIYTKSALDPKASLNIEVEAGLRRVHLQDNFFEQYDVYAYENGNTKSIQFPIRTARDKNISKPIYHASVKLSKDWGKESTNYVFLRLKYQWQRGQYNFIFKDQPNLLRRQDYSNHFFQVNLGLSLGLEDLFKKK